MVSSLVERLASDTDLVCLGGGLHEYQAHEAVGASRVIGKSLSCEPGEADERPASLRMTSDSAAAYGQSRYAARLAEDLAGIAEFDKLEWEVMMTISVKLSGSEEERLAEVASRLKTSPEELAAAAVRDLVGRQDPEFEATAQRVLEKNRELYERLR